MKFIERFIVLIFSLFIIALGAVAIMMSLNPVFIEFVTRVFEYGIGIFSTEKWPVLAIGAGLVVVGVIVLFTIPFRFERQVRVNHVATAGDDNVKLSIEAINSIIMQVTKSINGLSAVETDVAKGNNGILVKVVVKIDGSANIPNLASEMQQKVKEQLENMAGLQVENIKLVVSDINQVAQEQEAV